MKSTTFARRPRRVSGSTWRRIFEIVNRCGQFSPKAVARRAARKAARNGGANE